MGCTQGALTLGRRVAGLVASVGLVLAPGPTLLLRAQARVPASSLTRVWCVPRFPLAQCAGASRRAREVVTTSLLVVLFACCVAPIPALVPLCEQPGPLVTQVEGRRLCLDTGAGGRALVLGSCDPLKVSQWWQGRSGSAHLVLSDSLSQAARGSVQHALGAVAGVCADSYYGLTTSACPGDTTAESTRFSFTVDDARHIGSNGRCLGISTPAGSGAVAIHPVQCDDSGALVWEQPGCRPLPELLDTQTNWARGAVAVLSSQIGGSEGGSQVVQAPAITPVTDGYPDAHGWSNAGCPGVHSNERDDELQPWVTVDLGRRVAVQTVQLWTRPACSEYSQYLCQNRLWRFSIYVGDEPPPAGVPELGAYAVNGPPCAVIDSDDDPSAAMPRGMYTNVACANRKEGRFVTVQQTQSLDVRVPGVLNLCQIRVFGDDMTPPPPPTPPAPSPPRAPAFQARLSLAVSRYFNSGVSLLHHDDWCDAASNRHACAVMVAAWEALLATAALAVLMRIGEWLYQSAPCRLKLHTEDAPGDQSTLLRLPVTVSCRQCLPPQRPSARGLLLVVPRLAVHWLRRVGLLLRQCRLRMFTRAPNLARVSSAMSIFGEPRVRTPMRMSDDGPDVVDCCSKRS